jgi:hypothetical protein
MMGQIFGKAIAVIVDLGERPKNFDGLWKVFRETNSFPKELYLACKEKGQVLEDFRYLTLDRLFWLTYTNFVSLPWSKRV